MQFFLFAKFLRVAMLACARLDIRLQIAQSEFSYDKCVVNAMQHTCMSDKSRQCKCPTVFLGIPTFRHFHQSCFAHHPIFPIPDEVHILRLFLLPIPRLIIHVETKLLLCVRVSVCISVCRLPPPPPPSFHSCRILFHNLKEQRILDKALTLCVLTPQAGFNSVPVDRGTPLHLGNDLRRRVARHDEW